MFNPNEHLTPLKGKNYLQVMWRLVWFRDEHPDWCIRTELVSHDFEHGAAVFHAIICNADGLPCSSGYGSETKKDFNDYLEKAETKAVGRALAMLGYGTQFAPELDEEDRIVDAPVERKATPASPLDYALKSGRFAGKPLGQVLNEPGGRDYLEALMATDGIKESFKGRICAALNAYGN